MIRLLIEEPGSPVAEEVWNAAAMRVSSEMVYAEGRAALAAAARGGRIGGPILRRAVQRLGDACDAMRLVAVDRPLARSAGELAEDHGLRGCDAVHLATALSVSADDVVLVTWDRDLGCAASASGLLVAPA